MDALQQTCVHADSLPHCRQLQQVLLELPLEPRVLEPLQQELVLRQLVQPLPPLVLRVPLQMEQAH